MGRPAGSVNKDTQELIDMAHKMGCSPFKILCHIAMGDWKALGYKEEKTNYQTKTGMVYSERITMDHRLQAASQAAQYLYPKRRAVEVRSISEETESKLIINFGGKSGSSGASTVDSREPVSQGNQEPSEGARDPAQSVSVQAVVQDNLRGAEQVAPGDGSGGSSEKS